MRKLLTTVVLAIAAIGLYVASASPVLAQSANYPPSNGAAVRDFGAQRPGQTFNKEDCGFRPGSTANVALNGRQIFTKQAESDGCVRMTVEVQNSNKIRIDGRNYDANRCAENTITVSGEHRNGGTLSYDNKFRIDCAGVGGTGQGRGGEQTARTGLDADDLSLAGAGLVTAGVVLFVVARRRRAGTGDVEPSTSAA